MILMRKGNGDMKNFVYHDAVDGLRTAYEGSKDALECLMSIPDMTAQAATEHHAAMLSGMTFAKDDFERYASGQIGKEEMVRSAGEHIGVSSEMDAEAFYAAGRLPVSSEDFAAAALMLRSRQGKVEPDHLAAAFYAACIDHASAKDTLRAAQAAGYCIALQYAAMECAAQTSLSVTNLDEFVRENEDHIITAVFLSTCILSELIACGLAVWLSLNGIVAALLCVGVFFAMAIGALAVSESYENGAIREYLDAKGAQEMENDAVEHVLAQRALQFENPIPLMEPESVEMYDEYTDNEDIWPNNI